VADRRRDSLAASATSIRTSSRDGLDNLTAAATIVHSTRNLMIRYDRWQDESWAFADAIGEYDAGINWLSSSLSRVRLMAAKITRGGDEPEPIEEGPAADIMAELAGGLPGQAAMMADFGVHLTAVGDCWLTGEVQDNGEQLWAVRSAEEVQPIQAKRAGGMSFRGLLRREAPTGADEGTYQIQVDDGVWRTISPDSLVCRIWEKDRRRSWKARSVGKAAIGILREIDLYNRRIIALLISRLAMNGILTVPEEMTIPVRPEFQDAPNPLVAELVEIAARAISEPGTALAAIPIPWRVPAQFADSIKHITFHEQGTQARMSLLDDRDKAITRLARTLRMPLEALLGTGDSNHWNAWLGDEQSIKIYISPPSETVCGGLTVGYLHPRLRAASQPLVVNGDRIIVWYDTSELTAKPDKSEQAAVLHDRIVISDESLRKESGFDESAEPTQEEIKHQALIKLLGNPQLAAEAYEKLTGDKFTPPAPPPGAPAPNGPGEGGPSGNGATAAPGGGNTRPDQPGEAPSANGGPGQRPVTVVVQR